MNRADFLTDFNKASPLPMNDERFITILRNSHLKMSDGNNVNGSLNLIIVMEELAELQQEISKFLRNKGDKIGLIEELADVLLGVGYVKDICNISDEDIIKALNVKMERQNKRNPETI